MNIKELSITFHTNEIKECVDFYVKYFQAKVAFDSGWYVMVRMMSDNAEPVYLSFQSNEVLERDIFTGGLTINLMVDDVDFQYKQFENTGIAFFEKITDHEWGDRAFSIKDPIGNLLYIYSERPLADKYKEAVKE